MDDLESRPEFQEALDRRLRQLGYQGDMTDRTEGARTPKNNGKVLLNDNLRVNKSPSEPTIYVPAVRKVGEEKLQNKIPSARITEQQVSEQLDKLRLQLVDGAEKDTRRVEMNREIGNQGEQDRPENLIANAKEAANLAIIQAEKFKAKLNNPTGMAMSINTVDYLGFKIKDDDEFVHICSHIDLVLRDKIKRGEYVELEKLIKRNRTSGLDTDREMSLDVISKDGHTYLAPKNERSVSISGIREVGTGNLGCMHPYTVRQIQLEDQRSGSM